MMRIMAVSYTHLDVYKRQTHLCAKTRGAIGFIVGMKLVKVFIIEKLVS